MKSMFATVLEFFAWLYGEAESVKGRVSSWDLAAVAVDALTFGSAVAYFASGLATEAGTAIGAVAGALKAVAALITKWQSGPSEVAA